MRKVLKWFGRIVATIVLLIVVAVIVVYAGSQRILGRTYQVNAAPAAIPTDAASIAEGKRMARFLGCYKMCHGKEAEGLPYRDDGLLASLLYGKFFTPDLTRATHELSDRDLVLAIRHGVKPDGRAVWSFAPHAYYDLSDENLGQIIAFLRSLPPSDGPSPGDLEFGLLPRAMLLLGKLDSGASGIDHDAPRLDPGGEPGSIAHGRYLTHVICSSCHDRDLSGGLAGINLTSIADYTPAQFSTLMRTMMPPDPRPTSKPNDRWAKLTDAEIDAMYRYLGTTLAKEQNAAGMQGHAP